MAHPGLTRDLANRGGEASRSLVAACTIALAACGGSGGATRVSPPVPSATAAPALPPPDLDSGIFASKRFGARLALPGKDPWKIDDTRSPWLTAVQDATRSNVLMRTWGDENRMTRDTCEARARGLRALPTRDGATLLEQRRLDVPPGFDTVADVLVDSDTDGGAIYGFVLAFGGNARRCFAYVYATSATGAGGEERVADRLAQIVERSLSTLVFQSDLDPRPAP